MGRATQPRRVNRYTLEFKLSAVQLSKLRGVQIQDVAQALDIHPFMLSRWRKEAREGRLRGKSRKLWQPTHLWGAAASWHRSWPQARSSSDARGGLESPCR